MADRIHLPFVTSRVLVISDFNCPYCYTLNEWIHAMGAGARVRWVGIEHRPDLPMEGANAVRDLQTLEREVADVQRRAPEVEVVRPAGWWNSRKALLLQNALEDEEPEQAHALRRRIFRRYWHEGVGISEADLQLALADVGLSDVEGEPEFLDELSAWWRETLDRVPCMLAPTGVAHLGLQDFPAVRSFLNSALRTGSAGPGCR